MIMVSSTSVSANSGGTTTNCNPHSNAGCSQWDGGDRLKCTEPDEEKGVRELIGAVNQKMLEVHTFY